MSPRTPMRVQNESNDILLYAAGLFILTDDEILPSL